MNKTKIYGNNGNIFLNRDKKVAVKTLKDYANTESRQRYHTEIKALQSIKELGIPNIVEIIKIESDKIEMRLYKGNLNELFPQTKGNLILSCRLLLPVVIALQKLTKLNPPIYHRDIKPDNILYDFENNDIVLYLTDFGCCYLSEESDRVTDIHRAVGARAYRAPEFEYGKVISISEKGDIYSIGKVLWAMINGVVNEVFPYNLWFTKDYNLKERFPDNAQMSRANIIVGSCTSVDNDSRPSYEKLIKMLQQTIQNDESNVNVNEELAQEYEQKRIAIEKALSEISANFVNLVIHEIKKAFEIVFAPYAKHLPRIQQLCETAKRQISLFFSNDFFNNVETVVYILFEKDYTFLCNYHTNDNGGSFNLEYRLPKQKAFSLNVCLDNGLITYNGSVSSIKAFFEHFINSYISQ